MKASIDSKEGKKVREEQLKLFDKNIREDLAQKVFEVEKSIQPYASFPEAGKQSSASGRIRHRRHKWRSAYGLGISRIPRKIFWRRGTRFFWVGAEVSGTRGGRRAHPPKVEHFLKIKKINKREVIQAFESAIAATANKEFVKKRYSSLGEVEVPIIFEKGCLGLKTKDFFLLLKKVFKENFDIVLKDRKVRAGKGKRRNRKYKETAGLLMIIGKEENVKIQGIKVMKTNELEMSEFIPLGRLTVYTEAAIKELEALESSKKGKVKEKKK